ncbi:hypothetical protein F4780DRAFT_728866 [Xylariomycetidae sp. FL0641]|nr:hypothetical protein F4780DRAFT_728866 [Xylariomycetidae sp. FL0641]
MGRQLALCSLILALAVSKPGKRPLPGVHGSALTRRPSSPRVARLWCWRPALALNRFSPPTFSSGTTALESQSTCVLRRAPIRGLYWNRPLDRGFALADPRESTAWHSLGIHYGQLGGFADVSPQSGQEADRQESTARCFA